MNDLNGILIIDKPANFTSRDVVNKVSSLLNTKKIGHTGTLDPIATGVLVLTIGKCTKLSNLLTSSYKEYIASFKLGFETDTLDITGTITKKSQKNVTQKEIEEKIHAYKGKYNQTVPKYSAVKINGKKLYEYARENIDVELPSRIVDIQNIEILSIEKDEITIKTTVSKGTYIRSLIRDIGTSLETYATMTSLKRIKQGKFSIEDSYTIENIEEKKYSLLKPIEFLNEIDSIEVNEDTLKKVQNGVKLQLKNNNDLVKFTKNNEVIAIYQKTDDYYKMYLKF